MQFTIRKINGFTLVEVLVATAIMALIGIGAIKVFNTASETSNQFKQKTQRLNEVQRAFMLISDDIQQITTRRVRDEFGDEKPMMKSEASSSIPYFHLTRLGRRNPAQLARSNLEHLVYSLEDKTLFRNSYTYADGMAKETVLKRSILKSVEEMNISFYDGKEWLDYWPPINQTDDLPRGVKLTLQLEDFGELQRLYAIADS